MSSVAGKKYKVIITEVMLKAAMVGIHPDILKSHACTLKDKPAIYPFNRADVKTFAVPKGQYNINQDEIFEGKIPNRLVLGMVSADAYAGDLTKNPFNFKHYNFDFMCLYANGHLCQLKLCSPSFPVTLILKPTKPYFLG